jgi:hypothetical protein
MTIREKIVLHVKSLPPFPTTYPDLAKRLGCSAASVAVAVPMLLAAGKLRIVGRDGARTLYEVAR